MHYFKLWFSETGTVGGAQVIYSCIHNDIQLVFYVVIADKLEYTDRINL